jgi:hypothetical protein
MSVAARAFVVRPLAGRRWQVTSEGSPAVAMFVSQRDAIQYAHACAQAFRPSIVRVLTPDGGVEDAWSYGMLKGIRRDATTSPPDHPPA